MAALALSRRHRSALLIIIIIFIAALLFQRPYWLRNFSAPPCSQRLLIRCLNFESKRLWGQPNNLLRFTNYKWRRQKLLSNKNACMR
jgi:hypothetical protein